MQIYKAVLIRVFFSLESEETKQNKIKRECQMNFMSKASLSLKWIWLRHTSKRQCLELFTELAMGVTELANLETWCD